MRAVRGIRCHVCCTFRRATPDNLNASDSICRHYTRELWQDVAIDLAKGRIYLAQDEMGALRGVRSEHR